MKKGSIKSHINIPELISKFNKENVATNNRVNCSPEQETPSEDEYHQLKQWVSDYQCKSHKHQRINPKVEESKLSQIDTNSTTKRDHQQNRSYMSPPLSTSIINQQKLQKLENLMTSPGIFINPDKWQDFLEQAKDDHKYKKALSIFMYTYFIENYNNS